MPSDSGAPGPGGEGAGGGPGLAECAAVPAEVDAAAAVAGEAAEHPGAAAPVHAAGDRRDHAVVVVAAAVALEVAAQVGPPVHAVGLRRAGHVHRDDVRAPAPGGRRRTRQRSEEHTSELQSLMRNSY